MTNFSEKFGVISHHSCRVDYVQSALCIFGFYICRWNQSWIESIWEKHCVCTEDVQTFGLMIFPLTIQPNNYLDCIRYHKQSTDDLRYTGGCEQVVCKYYTIFFFTRGLEYPWSWYPQGFLESMCCRVHGVTVLTVVPEAVVRYVRSSVVLMWGPLSCCQLWEVRLERVNKRFAVPSRSLLTFVQ
jgi:hypothetical protein